MRSESGVRQFLRTLKHIPDRLLHPYRRTAAAARICSSPPRSILFLCHGNICRSPYAERALLRCTDGQLTVLSAGFLEGERPAPAAARAVASQKGLDLDRHRSRSLDKDLIAGADLVVVMTRDQARVLRTDWGCPTDKILLLGDLDPQPIDTRAIIDPVDRSEEVFRAVYDRIDACVAIFCNLLKERIG